MKHTARGTCQVCGAVQAVTAKGVLAKHGYTVDYGFFNGVCRGADAKPLEQDRLLIDATIIWLKDEVVPQQEQRRADLQAGKVEPVWFIEKRIGTSFHTEKVKCEKSALKPFQIERQINSAIFKCDSEIRSAQMHRTMLKGLIGKRHGQPLFPAADAGRKELKVGSKVRVGGKKDGTVCEVIEIKYQTARGCGPNLNGQHIQHAIFAIPNGLTTARGDRTVAIPTRHIRQDAILA